MDLQNLLGLIETAFADVPRDDDCTLHHAQLRDCTLDWEVSEAEWIEAKLRDPETDWRDVPAASIDECDAALSHATPKCWLFYMPAYMRRALALLDTDLWLPGSVIFSLTYRSDRDGLNWYTLKRFKQMSSRQEEAVIAFLNYIAAYPSRKQWNARSAIEALTSYWLTPPNQRPSGIVLAS